MTYRINKWVGWLEYEGKDLGILETFDLFLDARDV